MLTILSVAGLVVLLDQASKFLAARFLQPIEQILLIPNIFHLSYVRNTGIAFGMFQNYPSVWITIISVSVVFLLIASVFFMTKPLSQQIAYGFILGGATGNLIDRIRFHYVIDFLDFRIWPVFNVADSFITIGVVFLIWFAMKGH